MKKKRMRMLLAIAGVLAVIQGGLFLKGWLSGPSEAELCLANFDAVYRTAVQLQVANRELPTPADLRRTLAYENPSVPFGPEDVGLPYGVVAVRKGKTLEIWVNGAGGKPFVQDGEPMRIVMH